MVILILTIIVCAIYYIKIYLHKKRLLKYVQHLPTSKELPLFGCGHHFIGRSTIGIMKKLVQLCEAHPNPSRCFLGPNLCVFVSSPEDCQVILNSPQCLQRPYIYDFVEPNNKGLFHAEAKLWKHTRKLLNPTFNNKILSSFIPSFNEKSKIMAESLEKLVGKSQFDISKQFYACTLEMVCATALGVDGVDFEFQNGKNEQLMQCLENYTEVLAERMMKVWLHWDFIFKRSKLYKIQKYHLDTFDYIPRTIRKIKEKEFNDSKLNTKENSEEKHKEPQIFVNELFKLKLYGLFDDKMVDDQIKTIIAGANETSALTSSHVILMLAIHQDIQERAFQEIKLAHSNQYSDTNIEVMTKLNYLEMVIRETMRIFPVGPFLARVCLEDINISNCTLPKSTFVILAIHHLHRDKSVWGPDSEKFNPDNFLPERMTQRHPYSYLPFSGGPRNCIGMKYGWFSMKIMLSTLLRRYKFTTDIKFEDIVTKWDVTLKIAGGNLVRVERRMYE